MSPRFAVLAATCLSLACRSSGGPAQPAPPTSEAALRVRIARAELARAGGVAELTRLATHGAPAARALALRGL
ncbi:MAG TPA: hypothetical protein VFP84_03740, partial [Kofleriaceae bacterium]|nr:hypothetical protein [Kofleriaceae bacterium]